MVSKANWIKIQLILVFLYLALFPFGQMPRFMLSLVNLPQIHLTDVIVILSFGVNLIKSRKIRFENQYFYYFVIILCFGFVLSIPLLGANLALGTGIFYLIRLISYLYFFYTVKYLVSKKYLSRKFVMNSLLLIGSIVALVGLVQYLVAPDLRSLYTIGWDDHLYRLTSTFMDPAFTGSFLALTVLLAISMVRAKPKLILLLVASVSFVALMLTYSRSSYIALVLGLLILFRKQLKQNWKIIVLAFGIGIMIVFLLPKPEGEGVKLLRTRSIYLKFENYNESLVLIKNSPLFGYGYNNICMARTRLGIYQNSDSHACSGLDNSLLFLLSSVGVVGSIVFIDAVIKIKLGVKRNLEGEIFLISGLMVLIHSMFTNTLFYPWILGWLALLYGVTREQK